MSQVVTELVIDANTSGADQFSQSMDRAKTSADQGLGSVAGLTLAVAGVGVAFVGALAGLRGFFDYVGNTNKQLVDIADNASAAGMSTKVFQESLFAARSSGLTEKDFVSGLDKIGADITAASRGVTEFGKLFEANGISIRKANGEIKTSGEALLDIMKLAQNSTPQVAAGVARIVGVSKEWIAFLRAGTDEFEKQKQAAASLGVIIDDAVIQKARDFDREWKKTIATWDTQFKASLMELLPLMVKLAGYAVTIIEATGKVYNFFSRSLTPVDDHSVGDLQKDLAGLRAFREEIESAKEDMSEFQRFKLENKTGALGLDDNDLGTIDAAIAKVQELIKQKQALVRIPVTGGSSTVLPQIDGNDAVDRAIIGVKRHTEVQLADARAVGLGAEAQALFRAEALLNNAVVANGNKVTAEQRAQFEGLAKAAGEAAAALARARIDNEIRFGAATSLLSPDDVAIARQLKDIYPDVAQALDSVQASGIRTNAALGGLSSTFSGTLTTGLADIFDGTKKLNAGFADMGKIFARAIEEMVIKIMIVQPLMRSLQGLFSGLGIGFSAPGGAIDASGSVVGMHSGGIVGSEATFSRYVHPSHFDDAPRFHTGGIAGDEVPIIAKRGEGVFTPGQMAAMGGTAPQITFNVIEDSSRAGQREQTQSGNGGFEITQFVDSITAKNIGNPGSATRQTMGQAGRVARR